MQNIKRLAALFVTVGVSVACAAPPATTDSAPEATTDALDEADFGESWNGWTQNLVWSMKCTNRSGWQVSHQLTRTSGDATRGGGACLTVHPQSNFSNPGNVTCSDDAVCVTTAQSYYGPQAYGYCMDGGCIYRPWSPATACVTGSNRSPGTLLKTGTDSSVNEDWFAVGCMTKTAGTNTSCGGTNPSLYMRSYFQLWHGTCP